MNAVIYIRVSTTEQAEKGYSLKVQEEACLKYALSNSYEVLELFREEGKSAKTADRPELQRMLKYMNKNKKTVDALIVYKMDRLGRNSHDISSFRLIFDTLGIKLLSATEAFDNSSMGNFMQTMLAGMAQYENDLRSERTRSGMMKAVD